MIAEDFVFVSHGLRCAGLLHLPDGPGPWPLIVFCPGMSLTKEVWLPEYGRALAEVGYATLHVDYRGFGASEGEPRRRLIPQRQVEDVVAAIEAALADPRFDPDRIGVFGASLGAGVAVGASAAHPAVRATVAVAGPYDLWRVWSAFDGFAAFDAKVRQAREDFEGGAAPRMISVARLLASDPETVAKLVADEPKYPGWSLEVTFESLYDLFRFRPELDAARVRALMVIQPRGDALIAQGEAEAVIAVAQEPKRLVWLDGVRHVDIYGGGAAVAPTLAAARAWFDEHLR